MAETKSRNPRTKYTVMNTVHFLLAMITVIYAIIALIHPERHLTMIPGIFALAAVLCLENGIYRILTMPRGSFRFLYPLVCFLGTVVMAGLFLLASASLGG